MTSAIIVAAGKGTRMGPHVDKLFLPLNGLPVVAHTWRRFDDSAAIDEIVLVIRDGQQQAFSDLGRQLGTQKPFRLILGGKERQDSVWNGLDALAADAELVVIQDGARPCTPGSLIARTVMVARETGAAVAAQPVTDTIKESDDGTRVDRTLDRSRLWAVQTPQVFRVEVIRRALALVRNQGRVVTDDTAACELLGHPVHLVVSVGPNPKITQPEDLPYVEFLLKSTS